MLNNNAQLIRKPLVVSEQPYEGFHLKQYSTSPTLTLYEVLDANQQKIAILRHDRISTTEGYTVEPHKDSHITDPEAFFEELYEELTDGAYSFMENCYYAEEAIKETGVLDSLFVAFMSKEDSHVTVIDPKGETVTQDNVMRIIQTAEPKQTQQAQTIHVYEINDKQQVEALYLYF